MATGKYFGDKRGEPPLSIPEILELVAKKIIEEKGYPSEDNLDFFGLNKKDI